MRLPDQITPELLALLQAADVEGTIKTDEQFFFRVKALGDDTLRVVLALYHLGFGTRRSFNAALEVAECSDDPELEVFELIDSTSFGPALQSGLRSFTGSPRYNRTSVLRRKAGCLIS